MKHQKLKINTDLATQILTGFISSELNRVGFTKAVIGLSGGIDSALSCFLAAKALGPENVLAIRMPYKTSSKDSLSDAQKVIDSTGVLAKTIEITDVVQPLLDSIPTDQRVRRGNAMARTRMMFLFDQSAEFNGLVVGTSNKTEILLGYSTQWGDSACAINPIGDLYKAQVRELSSAIGVPQSILDKAPSADLWSGQTDEAELGFTYHDVDQLFYYLIDQRYSPEKCIEIGFDEKFVGKVLDRVRMTHYKRVMPPIAKLSNRTVGYDFLYLRDWGT